MKIAALILVCLLSSAKCAESWNLHFEADKGDASIVIPRSPKPLEGFLFEAPRFSPDPLDHDSLITNSMVRKIGHIGSHSVLEIQNRVQDIYYSKLYILLIEMTPQMYLPIYGQQYREGVRSTNLASKVFDARKATLRIRIDVNGTGGIWMVDEVSIEVGDNGDFRVSTKRESQNKK